MLEAIPGFLDKPATHIPEESLMIPPAPTGPALPLDDPSVLILNQPTLRGPVDKHSQIWVLPASA